MVARSFPAILILALACLMRPSPAAATLRLDAPYAHAGDPVIPMQSAMVVDLDGDGIADVVADRVSRDPDWDPGVRLITLWHGRTVDPSGQFLESPVDLPAGRGWNKFAAGDLDGDGDLDLVAASEEGVLSVYRNDGGWPGLSRVLAFTLDPVTSLDAVLLHDLDDDGAAEILLQVSIYHVPAQLKVFEIDPGPPWACREAWWIATGVNSRMAWVHPVAGGRGGLVLQGSSLRYLAATGDPAEPLVLDSMLEPGPGAGALLATDLDNDGRSDLVTMDVNWIFIHRARAEQTPGQFPFEQVTALPRGDMWWWSDVLAGDLTGDGIPDVLGRKDDVLYLWRGEGTAVAPSLTYAGPERYDPGSRTPTCRLDDFDLDGRLDLLVIDQDYGRISGLAQAPPGQEPRFPQLRRQALSGGSYLFRGCDFNADGRCDLLTAKDDTVSLLLATGPLTGPAPYEVVWQLPMRTYVLAACEDLTGDGRLDLLDGYGNTYVYDDTDGPGFRVVPNPGLLAFGSTCVFDADGDGVPDLAVGRDGPAGEPDTVIVYRGIPEDGHGSGRFELLAKHLALQGVQMVSWDVDGDALQDLIIVRGYHEPGPIKQEGAGLPGSGPVEATPQGDGGFELLLNDPAAPGTFRIALYVPVPRPFDVPVLATDLNGNGKLDLVGYHLPDDQDVSTLQVLADVSWMPEQWLDTRLLTLGRTGRVTGQRVQDMDGDGKPEILYLGGGVTILHNRGDLQFDPPRCWATGTAGNHVLNDFDGDGLPDLIAGYPFVSFIRNLSTRSGTPVLLSAVRIEESGAGLRVCCALQPPATGVRLWRATAGADDWRDLTTGGPVPGAGGEVCLRDDLAGMTPVTSVSYRLEAVGAEGTLGSYGPYEHAWPAGAPAAALELTCPNPLRGTGRILFALPRAGEVALRVYDVRGRLVRELAAGPLPAGRHEAAWDGLDPAGRPVASGVYFLRLQQGPRARLRKAILLR